MALARIILPLAIRQAIKAMRADGASVREVAKTLGINRNTASKYGRPSVGQNRLHGTGNR